VCVSSFLSGFSTPFSNPDLDKFAVIATRSMLKSARCVKRRDVPRRFDGSGGHSADFVPLEQKNAAMWEVF
jgi:hypothetical protein